MMAEAKRGVGCMHERHLILDITRIWKAKNAYYYPAVSCNVMHMKSQFTVEPCQKIKKLFQLIYDYIARRASRMPRPRVSMHNLCITVDTTRYISHRNSAVILFFFFFLFFTTKSSSSIPKKAPTENYWNSILPQAFFPTVRFAASLIKKR